MNWCMASRSLEPSPTASRWSARSTDARRWRTALRQSAPKAGACSNSVGATRTGLFGSTQPSSSDSTPSILPSASRPARRTSSTRSRCRKNFRAKFAGRIEPRVEQVPGRDVAERFQHRLLHARMLDLELHDQLFRALTLQPEIAARRTAAADDRQLALLRVQPRLILADVHERANDDVLAVVGH